MIQRSHFCIYIFKRIKVRILKWYLHSDTHSLLKLQCCRLLGRLANSETMLKSKKSYIHLHGKKMDFEGRFAFSLTSEKFIRNCHFQISSENDILRKVALKNSIRTQDLNFNKLLTILSSQTQCYHTAFSLFILGKQ